jgi:hypothetical protein
MLCPKRLTQSGFAVFSAQIANLTQLKKPKSRYCSRFTRMDNLFLSQILRGFSDRVKSLRINIGRGVVLPIKQSLLSKELFLSSQHATVKYNSMPDETSEKVCHKKNSIE